MFRASLFLFAILFVFISSLRAADLTIASGGQSSATIVVSPKAGEWEAKAAAPSPASSAPAAKP